MSYNGWTNRETWLVNIWGLLDDNESYEELIKDSETKEEAIEIIAQCLESDIRELFELKLDGFQADLYSDPFSEVNWNELAVSYIESNWKEKDTEDIEEDFE